MADRGRDGIRLLRQRETGCQSTMSLADKISPHLPQLRRFARLLTGSQMAGDAVGVSGISVYRATKIKQADLEEFERLKSAQTTIEQSTRKICPPRPKAPQFVSA